MVMVKPNSNLPVADLDLSVSNCHPRNVNSSVAGPASGPTGAVPWHVFPVPVAAGFTSPTVPVAATPATQLPSMDYTATTTAVVHAMDPTTTVCSCRVEPTISLLDYTAVPAVACSAVVSAAVAGTQPSAATTIGVHLPTSASPASVGQSIPATQPTPALTTTTVGSLLMPTTAATTTASAPAPAVQFAAASQITPTSTLNSGVHPPTSVGQSVPTSAPASTTTATTAVPPPTTSTVATATTGDGSPTPPMPGGTAPPSSSAAATATTAATSTQLPAAPVVVVRQLQEVRPYNGTTSWRLFKDHYTRVARVNAWTTND